ncbi:Hypothetical Protein FCC1311_097802 [Hondaea fermentalgiana]|uniref:Apple domain-containing protein n=1 Tax=Hondaea fermentalgiana TaxID=2315210 RepID=A0A2R5GRQ0_9STRA|nr:Hypothetical Protein FCC1311_097802 [Hondaea fermentalgiana]|eukprot:GBG33557.1 Hypothetical Protein FCC1311_097802 [Hondaea fermentalgiana]
MVASREKMGSSRRYAFMVIVLCATLIKENGKGAAIGGNCVNDILYDYIPISAMSNNITDTKLRPELCPGKPFYGSVPSASTRGAPQVADPESFDTVISHDDRLRAIQETVDIPHTVEVSDLTDAEIEASCLTVADCRLPPALTIIRENSTGEFWQPSADKKSDKFKDMFGYWCCDVNEPMEGFLYEQRNTNRKTIVQTYPAMSTQFRDNAKFMAQEWFPRTAKSTAEAKIIKIHFKVGKKKLYFYVDNTCNDLQGQRWQNGFMGNAARAGGGLFHEVIFKSENSNLPYAHNPASQEDGPVPLNTKDFVVQYIGNLKSGSSKFQWVAAKNLWYYADVQKKSEKGYRRMASVHMKTAMEWLLLAPPKGNLAVALMYVLASKLYLDAKGLSYEAENFDFSYIKQYQGHFYEHFELAIEHLMTPDEDSNLVRIFHALTKLDNFEDCLSSIPPDFYNQFANRKVNSRRPPESGCLGAASPIMDCMLWHSRQCANTYRVLYEARAAMWEEFHDSIPQCASCPGLIGWWRSGVTSSKHNKLTEVGRYPQCLPWRDSDGNEINNLGYDMYTSDTYELDYNEGYVCGPLNCRFADALYVPLAQLTEAIGGYVCANEDPLDTFKNTDLEQCRKECYTLTKKDDFACTSFHFNANTKRCKLYSRCSALTTQGASSGDVLYIAKPKVYNRTRSWDDPAEFYLLEDTPSPSSPAPTKRPTSSPTRSPTVKPTKRPTAKPTKYPTSEPDQEVDSAEICATEGLRYWGGRRLAKENKVRSLEACYLLCQANDACQGYTWKKRDSKCFLYDGGYTTKSPAAQAAAECVNDILYDYVSISELANNITDAKLRPELCLDKPFYGRQPAEHTRGTPHIPDPFKFDSALSSAERIEQFQAIIDEPHMVEISDLSDEEIAASCLTVEDCRLPPALTIIRKKSNGAFWQPYVQKSSYKYKDMFGHWCCDVNEPMDDFSYDQRNTNTKTILKSFPAISSQFRSGATLSKVTLFPSTATTATEAKIIRIDFRAESTDLYFYVDNTCNHLKGQRWQNGFMGNAARAGGGFFHEVIFKSYNTALPSAHNPASQANGPVPKNTDKFTVQYIGNFKPRSRRFQWVSVKNLWFIAKVQDKNAAGYRRMASVHLKTAMEWLLLAPPRGNLAVALMYLFAAKLYLDKAGGTNPYAAHRFDFSLIEEYQGHFYENYVSAVDHLMTQNEDSQMVRIFHALMELDGFESCLEAVPPSFYKQFSHTKQSARRPPESGCLGASDPIFDCTRWHSRRCANTYKVLYEARATMWKSFHESVPQCGSCPGLIGWWRSGVTSSTHEKLLEIGRYPQCLPWRDTDGTDVDNFGYDMYTSDAYELDYDEGYLCGPLYCRFADALYVPLEQVTEPVAGQICADAFPLKIVSLSTLDACRQKCYALTLNDDFACTSFLYNAATEKCKLYQRCSVLTTEGASSDDVMYVAKPKMYDPTRSWSDPADFYSRADTLAPTTLAPSPSPTAHPTMFPTDVPTMFPTMSPTDEPTGFPTLISDTEPDIVSYTTNKCANKIASIRTDYGTHRLSHDSTDTSTNFEANGVSDEVSNLGAH